MNRVMYACVIALFATIGTACAAVPEGTPGPAKAPEGPPGIHKAPEVKSTKRVFAETVTDGLDYPWGLAFLPNTRALVTERTGQLRFINGNGKLSPPIAGVPKVDFSAQGGLLDVAVSPDFAKTNLIYLSYSEPRENGADGTTVARAKLIMEGQSARLENLEVIFRQEPSKWSEEHFGGRILFTPDGSFFLTLGERAGWPQEAQNPDNDLGKLVRLEADGRPYHGNPKLPGWKPEIWSIGHRNMQGAALHPVTGKLWTVEHGPMGGDEINHPEAGKNYGWPVITYGLNYDGTPIGAGGEKEGLEQPVYYWNPSIAPSSLAFYTGTRF
ncbi:MAG: PQQ-dependent sugar dehydrogenase, partial [Alphaproteobacteria bacterium]